MFLTLLRYLPSERTTTQASFGEMPFGLTASWPVTSGCWHS